jgi:hypothetical protein
MRGDKAAAEEELENGEAIYDVCDRRGYPGAGLGVLGARYRDREYRRRWQQQRPSSPPSPRFGLRFELELELALNPNKRSQTAGPLDRNPGACCLRARPFDYQQAGSACRRADAQLVYRPRM